VTRNDLRLRDLFDLGAFVEGREVLLVLLELVRQVLDRRVLVQLNVSNA